MLSNIGAGEIIVVLLVLLFLFGGKKLPELARGLGESGKDLKKAKKEIAKALSEINSDEGLDDEPVMKQETPKSDPIIEEAQVEIPSQEGKTEGGETGNA